MKRLLLTLFVVAMMAVSYHASAATVTANFDFGAIADVSEYGQPSMTFTDNTISVTATGWVGSTAVNAYLDGDHGRGNAGLGVCQVLVGNQCSPSSDDNVTYGETLRLDFGEVVTIDFLWFTNGNHGTLFADGAMVDITGGIGGPVSSYLTHNFNTSLLSSGSVFEFYNPNSLGGSDVSNDYQFYLNNMTVSRITRAPEVPIPAAVWLFGSGLIGLVAVARRKHK